ncbi:hypothetical protein [Rickettsiella grylli]|uniref:hypothetical protein n=1 Tax=Rickettsiella grylli TaxID=59196 RepID=UPI0008FD88CE|nr:hypothetical protein [Rickettsiella grylli]
MPYMMSDEFLSEIKEGVYQPKASFAFLSHCNQFITIPLFRLIFLVIKRIVSIVKTVLKYFLMDLPVPGLIFLYILHLFRAFLTILDFFQDNENKNLVEVKKFLYAFFKVSISCLMLSFIIAFFIYGLSPIGWATYIYIKILFRVYTYSKLVMSLFTLGWSYYKIKHYPKDAEHTWLQANYRANLQKHIHILSIGIPITILLTLVSVFSFSLGGSGLIAIISLAGLVLFIDIAKAIYFHLKPCVIEIPASGSLAQHNAFIKNTHNDYYEKKCRTARLKPDPNASETNRIYLLKEIIVKIMELQAKLKENSHSRFNFFSEHAKYHKKIEGLKQLATTLLAHDYEKDKKLLADVFNALSEDYKNLNEKDETFISKVTLNNLIHELNLFKKCNGIIKHDAKATLFDELLLRGREKVRNTEVTHPQSFYQSFFRQQSDCKDISEACQAWLIQKDLTVHSVTPKCMPR